MINFMDTTYILHFDNDKLRKYLNAERKENMKLKKIGSTIVAFCMGMALLTANVQAAEVVEFVNGYERTFDVWDGSVSLDWGKEYERGGTLEINSAADFIAFRNRCCEEGLNPNYGGAAQYTPFRQVTVNLNCDIDLNGLNLKYGCGGAGLNNSFGGKFNGNGHIIKNLTINPNLPDAAEVQPALNMRADGAEATVNSATTQTSYVALFPLLQSIESVPANFTVWPSIQNLHLQDVNIHIPDAIEGDTRVAALVGRAFNGAGVASCSVKNVRFVGGPETYTAGSTKRLLIGGMIGEVAGSNNTLIANSYVNGVDFTDINGELTTLNNATYKAGLANVLHNVAFLNVYSANVNYNVGDTMNYDSLFYPFGEDNAQFMPAFGTGAAFSDNHERIISGTKVTDPKIGEGTVGELNPTSAFVQGGSSGTSYVYYMVPMSGVDFNDGYPICASERVIIARKGTVNADNSASFEVLNTSGSSQRIDIIRAGYNNDVLEDVINERIMVDNSDFTISTTASAYGGTGLTGPLGSHLRVPYQDAIVVYPAAETTEEFEEAYDTVKAFCWNRLNNLIPIGNSTLKNQ